MQSGFSTSRELNGFGSTSMNGSFNNGWKSTKPNAIRLPGQSSSGSSVQATRRPNAVPNPFSAGLTNKRTANMDHELNPVAARTVIGHKPLKKRRINDAQRPYDTSQLTYSKHFRDETRSISVDGPSSPLASYQSSSLGFPSSSTRTSTVMPDSIADPDPIDVDKFESKEDIGHLVPRRGVTYGGQTTLEIPPRSRIRTIEDFQYRSPGERPGGSSRGQPRSTAGDGSSTLRLREKFEGKANGLRTTGQLRLAAGPKGKEREVPEDTIDLDDEIMEFSEPEQAQNQKTPNAIVVDASSSSPPKPRLGRQLGEIDLKTFPKTNRSKISQMKLKAGTLTKDSRPSAKTQRDANATSRTPYVTNSRDEALLPLESYIWGKDMFIEEENRATPSHWLRCNEEKSALQIVENKGKKVVKSLDMSLLEESSLTISNDSSYKLIGIRLKNDRNLPDDVSSIGICLEFVARHGNMNGHWGTLKDTLEKKIVGGEVLSVIGKGAKSYFEGVKREMRAYDQEEPKLKRKQQPRPRPAFNAAIQKSRAEGRVYGRSLRSSPRNPDLRGELDPGPSRQTTLDGHDARRSNRLSEAEAAEKREAENNGELILVYPPSAPGAVHITKGDLRRLDDNEFLNDTIIELGFKLMLETLRERKPELAESVHVFSSFFFKKLANRSNKTAQAEYDSVKKWTAKVDIFKKRFILVPINENLHWYLAIIYRPEYTLDPPPPKAPTRTSSRVNNASMEGQTPQNAIRDEVDIPGRTPDTVTTDAAEVEKLMQIDEEENGMTDNMQTCSLDDTNTSRAESTEVMEPHEIDALPNNGPPPDGHHNLAASDSAAAVERMLLSAPSEPFIRSARHARHDRSSLIVEDSGSDDEDSEEVDQLDEDDVPTVNASSSESTQQMNTSNPGEFIRSDGLEDVRSYSSSDAASTMSHVEDGADDVSMDEVTQLSETHSVAMEASVPSSKESSAVPVESFYRSEPKAQRTYKKRSLLADQVSEGNDELDFLRNEEEKDVSAMDLTMERWPETSRTYIFTLDSLGTSHPKALARLNNYIQMEAKDKKGIEEPSPAITKKLPVPTQPNYSDCGLYLLHFAHRFLVDPDKYMDLIFSERKVTKAEVAEAWDDSPVKNMRKDLKDEIQEASEKWRKTRAEKENEKEKDGKADKDDDKNKDTTSNITPAAAESASEARPTPERELAERVDKSANAEADKEKAGAKGIELESDDDEVVIVGMNIPGPKAPARKAAPKRKPAARYRSG